jgi:hypothetical protein
MKDQLYSPAVAALLSEERLSPLGPGLPNEAQRPVLQRLTVDKLFAPRTVRHLDFGTSCLAGLWLYHDFLDESHNLSQSINSIEGSYWHGIMHRREPDYANAAYWFRQVGWHPVFDSLGVAASQLAATSSVSASIPLPWDPNWFIDYCRVCTNGKHQGEKHARLLQQKEWELLFDFCYRKALE